MGCQIQFDCKEPYVTDEEIEEIIEHVKEQGEPEYLFEQEELLKKVEMIEEQDELFEDVCRFVYEQGSASTSFYSEKISHRIQPGCPLN